MKVADYIVSFLEAQGIEYVFGYQGGMVTHMVDSLSKSARVRFVPCYHEQNAAFAAEGYARMSGKFGVCLVTSGPGATNTLTSVGNAFFDSIPVLYITGQVNTYEYKYDKQIRQQGFQEADIVSMARPVSKDAVFVDSADGIVEILRKAVQTMLSGRPGPVVLDLPMDIQRASIHADAPSVIGPIPDLELTADQISEIKALLGGARRPLVLCGGGIAQFGLNSVVREFLRSSGLPYVVSLMGKGLVDERSPNCLGMIGSYGNRCANMALSEADVVLVLGSRVDLRQTGNRQSELLRKILFIRGDVDVHELEDNPLPNQRAYHASVKSLMKGLLGIRFRVSEEWQRRLREISTVFTQKDDVARHVENKIPYNELERVGKLAQEDAVFVADIGQNQMWAAQMIRCSASQRFLTSGGMAPMGYAISAAVGAAMATHGRRQVVCICGDGGFHIGLQALMMISQYRLPITVVVFNNKSLGMIAQFQSLYFDGNMAGTTKAGGYEVPDVRAIADAYHLTYGNGLDPCSICEIDTHGLTTVVPKMEYNRGLNDMTPEWGQ